MSGAIGIVIPIAPDTVLISPDTEVIATDTVLISPDTEVITPGLIT